MDVRTITTATADRWSRRESPIDRGELRSVLSNLSHELSRPLISLKAGFDLLLGGPAGSFTPEQRNHIQTMVTLCDDLLRLTRSYLDYARLVQGSRPSSLGRYSLGALVQEVSRQFEPVAATRQVRWEVDVDCPEAIVVTDASRCQQILGNLASNALKYTPVGGRVRIVGRIDGDSWSVSIDDSGPGIPPEAIEMVFEPFYRLARDEHSAVEGNGLGLSICRELVAQLGGKIELTSTVGKGTCAAVRFPFEVSAPGHGGE